MKVPNISVFSAAMQGGFGLSSVLNVDMISPQPTFMMFADGLIKIKTQNSAFTGLILKLCFTAVIYYVWRERNSRRHEGNPSSKQNFWRIVREVKLRLHSVSSQMKLRVMDSFCTQFWGVHSHPAQPSMAESYSSSNPPETKVNTDSSVAIEAAAAAIARDFIGHPLWAFRKTVEWREIWKVELYAICHQALKDRGDGFANGHSEPLGRALLLVRLIICSQDDSLPMQALLGSAKYAAELH